MKTFHATRLLTLAYFLKTRVTPKRYNQKNWVTSPTGSQVNGQPACLTRPRCGTAACALGWAATIFPRYWRWDGRYITQPLLRAGSSGDPFSDAARFFGLTGGESERIFGIDVAETTVPRTPKESARIIEEIVDRYGYTYAKAKS